MNTRTLAPTLPAQFALAEPADSSSVPGLELARRTARQLGHGLNGILASYGLVLFGIRGWQALALVAATFLIPAQGALGLLGLVSARQAAKVLAPATLSADLDWRGANGLLVALILGLQYRPTPALVAVVLAAVLLAVGVGAALRPAADRYLGIPLLSLPFVLASWLALLGARRFAGLELQVPALALDPSWLPAALSPYLRSLGAIFLEPSSLAGALVLASLLVWSRWAAVLTVVGFASATATYAFVGGPQSDLDHHLLGFNAILCALATGGVFVVLSKASLVLAAVSASLATLLGAALLTALASLELPVLAAPFIGVTDAVLLALLYRVGDGPVQLVRGIPGRPEDALSRVLQQHRRYPTAGTPLVYLPVLGRWLVTQGPNGELTHQGLYAQAWDLEVADDAGQRWRGQGSELQDYYAFGAPVVAPADGRVVRAVGHVGDNRIGHVDLANNWGNTLVIAHAGGVYSGLSHLQQGSLQVREGDAVVRGQVLARVGNSGRSPVPHLHLQLQASPDVGAPTLAGEFLQYVQTTADGRRYVTHGSPQTDQTVEALQPDEAVRRALALPPGTRWNWSVRGEGLAEEEVWTSELDGIGQRHLQAGEARAALYIDDAYATVLDYSGGSRSLLALFAVACARVPFVGDATVQWQDSPSAMAFLSPWQRMGVELLLPFADRGALATHSHIQVGERGIVVTTRVALRAQGRSGLPADLPDHLELLLDPATGPVSLCGWRDGALMVQAEVKS